MHGWSDGDGYYKNYLGHPIQGAVSGYIDDGPSQVAPNAPTSIARIKANRTSKILSIGYKTRLDGRIMFSANFCQRDALLLPTPSQRVVELNQCEAFIQLSLCKSE